VGTGYLYFHAAPDAASFHQECVKRVKNLHTADCLRANKSVNYYHRKFSSQFGHPLTYRSTMAWGLEARVPFLDKAFLDVAMMIDPKEKLFGKGERQQVDDDGIPRMEKVSTDISMDAILTLVL
jgi:asparagine synthase (glutamine-hydrolysing)